MNYIAVLLGFVAGCCIAIIGLRWQLKKGVPIFGGILSNKINDELDTPDKILAIVAGISFFLCILFLIVQ